MIDLGRKSEAIETATPSREKNRIYYPSLYIDKKTPITQKDLGKTVIAIVKLKVTGHEESIRNGKERYRCEFDVLAIDFGKRKGIDVSKYDKADLDNMEEAEYKLGLGV